MGLRDCKSILVKEKLTNNMNNIYYNLLFIKDINYENMYIII